MRKGGLAAHRSHPLGITADESSSLGTHLICHFALGARILIWPLNGQETAGCGGKNGRSSPDPRLLSPLRDGWRLPCCCRGFLRSLSGVAAALGARRPRLQPVDRSASGKLHAAGPLAPAELRWGSGAGLAAGGVPGDLAGAQIAKEMPSRLVPSSAESLRPPIHLRSELPCRGRVAVVEAGSWEPAAEMLQLSAADGGAAAVHGRHAPAGPPPRCRRSTRRALCPVHWP